MLSFSKFFLKRIVAFLLVLAFKVDVLVGVLANCESRLESLKAKIIISKEKIRLRLRRRIGKTPVLMPRIILHRDAWSEIDIQVGKLRMAD